MEWTCLSNLNVDGHLNCFFEENANRSIAVVTNVLSGVKSDIQRDQQRIKDDVSAMYRMGCTVHVLCTVQHSMLCSICTVCMLCTWTEILTAICTMWTSSLCPVCTFESAEVRTPS